MSIGPGGSRGLVHNYAHWHRIHCSTMPRDQVQIKPWRKSYLKNLFFSFSLFVFDLLSLFSPVCQLSNSLRFSVTLWSLIIGQMVASSFVTRLHAFKNDPAVCVCMHARVCVRTGGYMDGVSVELRVKFP